MTWMFQFPLGSVVSLPLQRLLRGSLPHFFGICQPLHYQVFCSKIIISIQTFCILNKDHWMLFFILWVLSSWFYCIPVPECFFFPPKVGHMYIESLRHVQGTVSRYTTSFCHLMLKCHLHLSIYPTWRRPFFIYIISLHWIAEFAALTGYLCTFLGFVCVFIFLVT